MEHIYTLLAGLFLGTVGMSLSNYVYAFLALTPARRFSKSLKRRIASGDVVSTAIQMPDGSKYDGTVAITREDGAVEHYRLSRGQMVLTCIEVDLPTPSANAPQ